MTEQSREAIVNCPLCDGASHVAFKKEGHEIFDCGDCGHRFANAGQAQEHVSEVYGDTYFYGGGAGYSDYLAEEEMLKARGIEYARLIERSLDTKGVLLDIGAAAGCIMQWFSDSGWRCVGLEPNASMVGTGIERFGSDLRQGILEDFESEERFDLITMIQVAGHFYDPVKSFTNALELLKPGGHLLVETWDSESRLARLFGRNWHEYSPPSVLHWWSERRLTEFLKELGFKKIDGGRPSKRISGEHARSLLEYKLGNWAALRLIPKRLSIPYPSEDLFWALYTKG
ncbi:MAG: class I SAM-dependent methyltransferase [Pyrinomonadaceae bacterium]|nr:class I SAM-dependent methyltransferase [Pyrinomonadaceae bacterium]